MARKQARPPATKYVTLKPLQTTCRACGSRLVSFSAADLQLTDVTVWHALRQSLDYRHQARRAQLRFRRDPLGYLHTLEQCLLTPS